MSEWSARLYQADCLDVLRSLDGESVDAVVTDPPYEISFLNRGWDSTGIAFRKKTWEEVLRVLKPGGHLLAFGAARTYHRMTVAIEDAGFEIRDSLHWIYASGFPKALNVSKAIDQTLNAEREATGEYGRDMGGLGGERLGVRGGIRRDTPATAWDGWYSALKPAHEPIVLARKPLAGTIASSVMEHGTGALNIGASRIDTREQQQQGAYSGSEVPIAGERNGGKVYPIDLGRFPPNVLLAHLPECEGSGPDHTDVLCAAGCPVAELNEVSGETSSPDVPVGVYERKGRSGGIMGKETTITRERLVGRKGDSGGAARFFFIAKPRKREKIGGVVRNLHVTVKPVDLCRYLVRLVTPPGGTVSDFFAGSGSTGCAAMVEGFRFIGVEQEGESYETMVARVSDYAFVHGRPKPERASVDNPVNVSRPRDEGQVEVEGL